MLNTRAQSLPYLKLLCCLFFLQAAYFFNGATWNQNSRLNVIFSYVEPGPDQYSFKINKFIPEPDRNINTGDWSFYKGDYYSNKAPGTALLGIPFYFVIYQVESFLGLNVTQPKVAILNAYLINLWVSVLPITLAAFYFGLILVKLGLDEFRSTFIASVFLFGSLCLPYSTQLWGHVTACAFIVLAIYFILRARNFDGAFAGIAMGIAVLCDFLAVIPAFGCLILLLSPKSKIFLQYVLFGLVCALVLFAYNYSCFDSVVALPTDYMNSAFVDDSKALGMFGAFNVQALLSLTFGVQRGIFAMMPIIFLSLIGFIRWIRRDSSDRVLWCSLLIVIVTLILNSCFNGWHGGSTIAARYQIIALPFWFLALKEYPVASVNSYLLAAVSFVNMFVISSFGVLCPDQHSNPLYGAAYPFLTRTIFGSDLGFSIPNTPLGNLTPMPLPIRLQAIDSEFKNYDHLTALNWGEVFGLSEAWSLFPALIVVVIVYFISVKAVKKGIAT